MRNQVHNGVLEVVHYSTQKQLADVLTKVVKTKHLIYLRDVIGVVDFQLTDYELMDDVRYNSQFISVVHKLQALEPYSA